MAEKKYIDLPALSHFLDKIKGLFALKTELPRPPGDSNLFYNGEGNWTEAGKIATQSQDGFMSSTDKTKLDNITSGDSNTIVLADGTTMSIEQFIEDNIEIIRAKLGVVTVEKEGLVPKLPVD